MNETKRKYSLRSFPGMARYLRRQLIAALNRGEPSRKLTEEELRRERELREAAAAMKALGHG